MGRLGVVVLAGCLLLAAYGGGGGETRWASTDYRDFMRFGGVTYDAVEHDVGRPVADRDLGSRFALVRDNPPERDPTHAYRMRDGDAAFVPVGSPVFTVKGYRPSFRLAARRRDRLRLYEADTAVGAAPGPTGGRAEDRSCFVVFNLTDRTAVRRALFPGIGELRPGVFAPPAFTE